MAEAFAAFRRRDVERLAAALTKASLRAFAARTSSELSLTDREAIAILGGVVARLPAWFTDAVRCIIVGQVLEARLADASPDGRRFVGFDCRVAGAGDEWLAVRGERETYDDGAPGVAHVVFRAALEFPGKDTVPLPVELEIARTRLVDGEWKLDLDEWSEVGVPGFRGVGLWIDETRDVRPEA